LSGGRIDKRNEGLTLEILYGPDDGLDRLNQEVPKNQWLLEFVESRVGLASYRPVGQRFSDRIIWKEPALFWKFFSVLVSRSVLIRLRVLACFDL
jgi:hypothetical protein